MSLITINHTKIAYHKIINELTTIKKIVNYFVQFAFFCYYIYLILTHLESVVHLVLYGVMMAVLIFTFIIEVSIRDIEDGTRKEKKTRKENKKKIKLAAKIIKYLAKIGTITLALIDIIQGNHEALFVTLTAVSILVFIGKIIFDVTVNLFEKYATMMYLAVKLDIDDSEVIQSLYSLVKEVRGDEEENKDDYFTDSELKTMAMLRKANGDKTEIEIKNSKKKLTTSMFRSIAKRAIKKALDHNEENTDQEENK